MARRKLQRFAQRRAQLVQLPDSRTPILQAQPAVDLAARLSPPRSCPGAGRRSEPRSCLNDNSGRDCVCGCVIRHVELYSGFAPCQKLAGTWISTVWIWPKRSRLLGQGQQDPAGYPLRLSPAKLWARWLAVPLPWRS